MKKIVFMLLFMSFFTSLSYATTTMVMKGSPDVVITITLNLHSKKSDCMSGFGFCKISFGITFTDGPASTGVPAQVSLNGQNDLVIRIKDTDLQKYENGKSLAYLKGKKSVNIDDNYALGNELTRRLNAQSPLVIKAGDYPVQFDGTYYILVFPQD